MSIFKWLVGLYLTKVKADKADAWAGDYGISIRDRRSLSDRWKISNKDINAIIQRLDEMKKEGLHYGAVYEVNDADMHGVIGKIGDLLYIKFMYHYASFQKYALTLPVEEFCALGMEARELGKEDLSQLDEKGFMAVVRKEVYQYYLNNDEAHLIDHADDVVNTALLIASRLNVSSHFRRLCIIAGYYHDIHTDQRRDHHDLAYDTVMKAESSSLKGLYHDDLVAVANACREHRASYRGEFSGLLSQVISAADRGRPDMAEMLMRSLKYSVTKLDLSGDVAKARSLIHIVTKFNDRLYDRAPEFYCDIFKHEIAQFKATRNSISEGLVKLGCHDSEDTIHLRPNVCRVLAMKFDNVVIGGY